MPKIGILAIQGDFLEHQDALNRIGVESFEIRLPHQLDDIDGLIIPGGESTTIAQLIDIYGFRNKIKKLVASGMPVWGTCAGLIVMAKHLSDQRPVPLGLMDIDVSRNAFGRQVQSFEKDIDVDQLEGPPFHAIFIRAPKVNKIGSGVKVLASLNDGSIVAVRQGSLMGTSFHPELTNDVRIHEMFVEIVENSPQSTFSWVNFLKFISALASTTFETASWYP